jgi:hypothetical protein
LADFEELGDRPDGDAELFRGLDATKQWCHSCLFSLFQHCNTRYSTCKLKK